MYEHVQQLARDLDVKVWVCIGCDGEPYGETVWHIEDGVVTSRLVTLTTTPDTLESYLVALHELGHIATGRMKYRLDSEAEAWWWALRTMQAPPALGVWAVVYDRLSSYAVDRRFKHTTEFTRLLESSARLSVQSES